MNAQYKPQKYYVMNTSKITVLGSINMDIVARTDRRPLPSETVTGKTVSFIPGGKGANQAVAAARLGADVRLVGALGRDSFGDDLLTFLRKEKIDVSCIRRVPKTASGTALITVDDKGENSIIVIPGSNEKLDPGYINNITFTEGEIVMAQLEIPSETVLTGLAKARKAGAVTVLNSAPAQHFTHEMLLHTDYLIMNETECMEIFSISRIPDTEKAVTEILRPLVRQYGSEAFILTRGSQGVIAVTADHQMSVSAEQVKTVDTTGAGDCFAGAFAQACTDGYDLERALRYANTAAAVSVQRPGASSSLPYKEELDKIHKNG